MRIKLPEHISNAVDSFAGYLCRDNEGNIVVREDAPEEVKRAKQEYDEWAAKNKFRMEGCDG